MLGGDPRVWVGWIFAGLLWGRSWRKQTSAAPPLAIIFRYLARYNRTRARYGDWRKEMGAIIVIAISAGGLKPLVRIITALPPDFRASIFVVQHIGANPSVLPDILDWHGRLPAAFGRHGEVIERGRIYVAPPDHHMRLGSGAIFLDQGLKVHFARPAADPLFISAAEAYGKRVVGIVLSGSNSDGAEGMRAITARGGLGLVQDLAEAEYPEMPQAAQRYDHPEPPLTADQIAERIVAHCP